jgi:uncharacterized membrane protein YhaH (DUF805 family)
MLNFIFAFAIILSIAHLISVHLSDIKNRGMNWIWSVVGLVPLGVIVYWFFRKPLLTQSTYPKPSALLLLLIKIINYSLLTIGVITCIVIMVIGPNTTMGSTVVESFRDGFWMSAGTYTTFVFLLICCQLIINFFYASLIVNPRKTLMSVFGIAVSAFIYLIFILTGTTDTSKSLLLNSEWSHLVILTTTAGIYTTLVALFLGLIIIIPNYTFYNSILNSFDFKNRSGRREFWYFQIYQYIFGILIGVMSAFLNSTYPYIIFSILIFVPSLSVGIRRMHDVGKEWYFYFIPFYSLYLSLLDGDKGENSYGERP